MTKTVRLPKYISPQRYRITVRPDLDSLSFTGSETIFLRLKKPSRGITLHAVDLKISNIEVSFKKSKKKIILLGKVSINRKQETVTLIFAEPIPIGQAEISLEFSGEINERLHGFYRSSYEHKGQKKHIGVTQFEATDARRAFPCFDEPAHKAVFDVTMIVPKDHAAISNTLEKSTRDHDNEYKVVKFAPSPKMSTYLLAFISGDFESIETKTKDGVVVRIFATPGKAKQGEFSLDVAKRTLEFLSEYFAIPYPLSVMDMIAIPDFSAAAMENWGAVTYRETALLVDDETTPFAIRQRVAEVVAHELVHQWFGNLVTMEWWNDLWLNEGFASYMSFVAVDHLFPEWKVWTRFAIDTQSPALEMDSLLNTHPIEVDINHPHEIAEAFDAISYDKGGSVLHMLHHYLGPEMFRDGLRLYLKKHSYKNTSTIHLWEAFEKVSGKPIRKFMKVWTKVPGYPFVSAELNKTKLRLTQNQFTLVNKKTNQLWMIPIQVEYSSKKRSDMKLLSSRSHDMSVSPDRAYLKLNPEERSLFRVLYSPELLAQLLPAIADKKLDVLDRLSIIRDLFAFVKQGSVGTTTIFETLEYYRNEDSYVIWNEIGVELQQIEALLTETDLIEQFRVFARGIYAELVKRHGWEFSAKDTQAKLLLRALAIRQAGYFGHGPTVKKAQQIFQQRLKGKPLHADLRTAIYPVVARFGNAKTFESLLKLRSQATSSEEREHIERCLVLFQQTSLISRALAMIFSGEIRSQAIVPTMVTAFHNIPQRRLVLDFTLQSWESVTKLFAGSYLLGRLVGQFGYFNDLATEQLIRKFFKGKKLPGGERALKQSYEKMGVHRAWLARDKKALKSYFRQSKSVAK